MCNLYTPASAADLARQFGVAAGEGFRPVNVGPRARGDFIRPLADQDGLELVNGIWNLIPPGAPTWNHAYSTNNARFEDITRKSYFRDSWKAGQRCIIPVARYWEPCYESGHNQWWAFTRADGNPFGAAGLWNAWVNNETGEVFESYTMLTLCADRHPLMSRMHKPDPTLPPDAQDKRMVAVLEPDTWEAWLRASNKEAHKLIGMAPAKIFVGGPDPDRVPDHVLRQISLF